ncbi:cwf18 pre-mRNA splicing factor-domain-containing protein [Geopyxis carbonaria]|nr:cwf18 pre-mRNA splicing factor-domain-containing protein [Geopyxis carbonaria]
MSTASLDAAAAARKERLSQLKSLKRKQPGGGPSASTDASTSSSSAAADAQPSGDKDISHLLSGRNYDAVERAPKMGFLSAPNEGVTTLEEVAAQIAAQTLEARKEAEAEDTPIDLFKLQPKKPNWDLKRDVDRKMAPLEARTEMAIAKLIRARIEEARREKAGKAGGAEEGEAEGVEGNIAAMVEAREKEDPDADADGEAEEEEEE